MSWPSTTCAEHPEIHRFRPSCCSGRPRMMLRNRIHAILDRPQLKNFFGADAGRAGSKGCSCRAGKQAESPTSIELRLASSNCPRPWTRNAHSRPRVVGGREALSRRPVCGILTPVWSKKFSKFLPIRLSKIGSANSPANRDSTGPKALYPGSTAEGNHPIRRCHSGRGYRAPVRAK
jgi:hypothetical protein